MGKRLRVPSIVLLHSPITDPTVWTYVADELRTRGWRILVPDLQDNGNAPFWIQHIDAAVAAVFAELAAKTRIAVVGFSGAGALLAHVGNHLRRHYTIEAYILLDSSPPAQLPSSRLDAIAMTNPSDAVELLRLYSEGIWYPNWTEEDLKPFVTDAARRRILVRGIRQKPLSYWEEIIPPVGRWPDAPCSFLLTSQLYAQTSEIAYSTGGRVDQVGEDNHFLLIERSDLVAQRLQSLLTTEESRTQTARGILGEDETRRLEFE